MNTIELYEKDIERKNSGILRTQLGKVIIVFAIFTILFFPLNNMWFICMTIFTMLLLSILTIKIQSVKEFYNPIILLVLINFIMFGFAAIYVIVYPEEFYRYNIDLDILSNGMLHILLCFCALIYGYYTAGRNKFISYYLEKIRVKIPSLSNYYISNVLGAVLVFEIIGWISRYLIIQLGRYFFLPAIQTELITEYAGIMMLINIGSQLPIFAVALIFISYLTKGGKKYLIPFLLFIIVEIAYYLPTGSKEQIFFPFFIILVIFSIIRGTPKKTVVVAGFIAVFLIFPLTGIYRYTFVSLESVKDLPILLSLYLDYMKNLDFEVLFFNIFGVRLNSAAIVSVLVDKTPEIWNFQLGLTYLFFFISFVPRLIWPGKPVDQTVIRFGVDYNLNAPEDIKTANAVTWIGETFLNFGWLGFIAAFFIGILYRFIYNFFLSSRKVSNLSLLMFSAALYMMIRGDQLAGQFAGLLQLYIVLIFLLLPFLKRIR